MEQYNGFLSVLFATIEFIFLVNVFAYAERNRSNKIAFGTLLLLFGYQFFEAIICAAGYKTQTVIAFAFVDITFLPPMGLLLAMEFLNKKPKIAKYLFHPYVAFAIYFVFNSNAFGKVHCTPFAASYSYGYSYVYAFFYYTPIITTIFLLIINRKNIPIHKKNPHIALTTGFVITFVPFFLAFPFLKEIYPYVESVLCKIAFLLAIFLTFFIMLNGSVKDTATENYKSAVR